MTRIVFTLLLFCLVVLSILIWLVSSAEYTAPNLLIFFRPSSACPPPCFTGIHPGVSTVESGIAHLQESLRPTSITLNLFDRYNMSSVEASVLFGEIKAHILIEAQQGIIERIYLTESNLRLGDILFIFGQPSKLMLDDQYHHDMITVRGFYPAYRLDVQALLPICSAIANFSDDLLQSVVIRLETTDTIAENTRFPVAVTDEEFQGWATRVFDMRQRHCAQA
jgi:hypothetical protein